jgi:putative nucleotidyltransferase with HDIG domain
VAVAEFVERPWAFKKLQPLPPVAAQLMRMVSRDATFQGISALVRTDSAFAAEVLRIANSPLLGCRRRIDSIRHALTMLGMEKLKSLVMAVSLRDFLSSALQVPALSRCWRHSLACGCVSEELAGVVRVNKDSAYTAGLLHDVGRLALLASYPAEYARMLDISDEYFLDVLGCEEDLFDIDHCRAGEWLVSEWQFPEELAAVAGAHHKPPTSGRTDLPALVHFSCRLADACGFPVLTSTTEDFALLLETLPRELAARIGEDALVSFEKGNVSVRCRIVDARTAYGRAQLLVQPVAGDGKTWVEEARIRQEDKQVASMPANGSEPRI